MLGEAVWPPILILQGFIVAKIYVYSVFDKVACVYGPLFQAVNNGIAVRNVVHMLENVKPYDRPSFVLFKMGSFNDETGAIDVGDGPARIDIDIPRFDDFAERKFSFEKEGE